MDERRPLDATAYGSMLFLCMAMGLQSISLKVIGQDIAPIMQIGLRSGMAVFLIFLSMWLRHENFALIAKIWLPGMFSGLFFALEYVLIAEALRYTTAARMTVFMYVSPLFSALILHFCKKSERLSSWQWVGVSITFGGVVAAFWDFAPSEATQSYPHMLFGDILALLGGLFWAFSTLVLRLSRLQSSPQRVTLLYQLGITALLLPLFGFAWGQATVTLTSFVLFNMAYQTLFIAFGCMLLWLWLLNTYAATRIGILSFLTPLLTIFFAILLLDEPVELHFIIGAILVVSGLIVISLSKNVTQTHEKKLETGSQNM